MTESQATPSVQTVEYAKPKLCKRVVSAIVDLLLLATVSTFLFFIEGAIAQNTEAYQTSLANRLEIQVRSGLFGDDGTEILTLAQDETKFPTIREKKDYLANQLAYFYSNAEFCTAADQRDYEVRKSAAVVGSSPLFLENASGELEENPSAYLDDLYSFYSEEIRLHATSLLYSSVDYVNLTRYFTFVMGIELLVAVSLAYGLICLLFPFAVFRRGRMTLGRALFHIGMIGADALTPKAGKFIGRFFFVYVVYLLLSFVSFLLPIVLSTGMMFLSRRNQDLADYVFNLYMVDASKKGVYLNFDDFMAAEQARQSASLENSNFKIDNHGV